MSCTRTTASLLLCTAFLAACSTKVPAPLSEIRGAPQGVFITSNLAMTLQTTFARPAPMLGAFATSYMVQHGGTALRAAIAGIKAGMEQVKAQTAEDTEGIPQGTFILLSQLGSVLEVDVTDLLNRSVNREQTVKEYLQTLHQMLELAIERKNLLEEYRNAAREETRAQKKKLTTFKSELSRALRSKDYTLAGSKQEEVTLLQPQVTESQSREKEIGDHIDLFEEFIETGKERLEAIAANREALVAGVTVVELPGVDNLGLLEKQSSRNRRSGTTTSAFDGE